MARVLLVDTNVSSGPIYKYLKKSGHDVYVAGANPKDFLAKCVENYGNFDYSNIGKLGEFIKENGINFIVPGCNDRSYQVCAELNKYGIYPGIDSVEVTETINNKSKFRAFASMHRLSIPKVLEPREFGTRWPVIVKPVDAYSGRGVTVLQETVRNRLQDSIELAKEFSRSKDFIIEDYVEGQLFSHTAFISNGIIIAYFIVEEHGTANQFVVDTSRVIYDFTQEVLIQLRNSIEIIAKQLRLCDGLVHTQFIALRDRHWIIEVTRRCPGDLYSQLIELSTGFNYVENYVRPFIGNPLNLKNYQVEPSWVMRHTISLSEDGVFGSIQFHTPLNIEELVPLSVVGDIVKASPYGRIGILFAKTRSEKELKDLFAITLSRYLYTVLR